MTHRFHRLNLILFCIAFGLVIGCGGTATESIPSQTSTAPVAPTIAKAVTNPTTVPNSTATKPPNPTVAPTTTIAALDSGLPANPTTSPRVLSPLNVTNNPGRSSAPHMAFDGKGNLHLIWRDDTIRKTNKSDGSDYLHRQRTPDGKWSDVTNLTEDFESIFPQEPKLQQRPDGSLCVFWQGASVLTNPDTLGLYMRCQNETGWDTRQKVGTEWIVTFDPVIASDGKVQYIFTQNQQHSVYYKDIELSDRIKLNEHGRFAIDSNGGFHAIWRRQGDPYSLEYRFSGDGGKTWSEQQSLTDEKSKPNGEPFLLADKKGQVHLVWSNGPNLLYRLWTPAAGWGRTIVIKEGSRAVPADVAIDSIGLVHLIYDNIRNVMYTRQQTDGSWVEPFPVANDLRNVGSMALAVDAQNVPHFAWTIEGDALDIVYGTLP